MASSTQTYSLRTGQQLKVLAPFQPIPDGKSWGVLLDVPEKVLIGPAQALKAELDADNTKGTLLELGLGLLAAIVGLLLVWLMARSVTRPILGNDRLQLVEETVEPTGQLTEFVALVIGQAPGQVAFAAGDIFQHAGHAEDWPGDAAGHQPYQ